MKKLLIWSAPLLLLAQAVTAAVKTDYDHGAQFSQYHTFQWKAMPAPTGGVVDNSITVDRVKRSIDQQVSKKGLEEATKNPDVYLVYHFNARIAWNTCRTTVGVGIADSGGRAATPSALPPVR